MSFSTGFRKCKKCGKTLFGLFDGELCDECEKAEQEPKDDKCHYCEHNFTPYQGNTGEFTEQEPIEKITLWGGEQFVSIETYQQVCKERDMAIEQLHELGYEFGQKIEPCDDVVSRQAVLDINESHHGQMPNHINHQIWQEIKDLPPVRPQEQKTGHWEFFCQHWRKCSECGYPHKFAEEWDYCPNCGARMESEVRNDRGRN